MLIPGCVTQACIVVEHRLSSPIALCGWRRERWQKFRKLLSSRQFRTVLRNPAKRLVEVRSNVGAMVMLRWAFIFLLISLVAGGLGFTGISAGAGRISKILFIIFGVLFLLVVLVAYLIGEAFF